MVKVCAYNYPKSHEEQYQKYYDKYSYPLHDFQKWAIEGIVEGHHVLVTAPTGSGKSLPAEFALDYFHSKGKKTIYTSPIKALSNEKFYNFTQKYPHISVGLITGDIKTNPDADVLIMTTEILLNKLYQIKSNSQVPSSSISFEMDIEEELGCVVFDEIHMINDESRGHVWEQSIMMLPPQIQMIGLSATLDNPEKFAYWLENRCEVNNDRNKIVYLTSKNKRTVPLIHYSFITSSQTVFKTIKDKSTKEEIKQFINKPHIIQDENNKLNDENFNKTFKMIKLFEKNEIYVKRTHVLNQITKYLTENEMTPAICYVFSIKKIEICANEITTNLQEFDTKVPYIIDRECEQILRSKLPNYEEYLHLPEYVKLVSLLRKGIATHHSKMLPILKEIVEIFFAKGYIKLLFATESVAIGLNLPVKTCIFTDINKHDGTCQRILRAHEYTQAAGRAGRLGLDTVGHVIHLNNLFRDIDSAAYKTMMNGKPQTLTSKFKISYNLLLNLLDIGDKSLVKFAGRSMVTGDLDSQMKEIYYKITLLTAEIDNIKSCSTNLRTPDSVLKEFIDLQNEKTGSVNKKRKEIERKIKNILENHKYVEQDSIVNKKLILKYTELNDLQKEYDLVNSYIKSGIGNVLNLLKEEGFIQGNLNDETSIELTLKGKISCQLREVHCLVFSNLLEDKKFENLSSKQLVSLFSIFTNISVSEELKELNPNSNDNEVQINVNLLTTLYREYHDKELQYNINTGIDYTIQYDLLNYLDEWCHAETVEECKLVLQKMGEEKQIFLGEFVKALLKINNISAEMEKIAELIGNIEFLSKLKEIQNMTMKYVVTNQSLYV